mmetsp:Transcript_3830/g.8646  ORF Transcript_3830/g.8646 Transcript_3830/m.8646 type:complete len:153 (+) Transcript_3830:27-485(+)
MPRSYDHHAFLAQLHLQGNDFLRTTIPSELGQLTNLTSLSLELNRLGGSIPSTLGNLHRLRTFHLEVNQLTGNLPTEFGQLKSLRTLMIWGNRLEGIIPQQVCNLWDGNLTRLADPRCTAIAYGGLQCLNRPCCHECPTYPVISEPQGSNRP